MDSKTFVEDLESFVQAGLAEMTSMLPESGSEKTPAGLAGFLKVALVNEINVSELAAVWMATTSELDIKLALAQQTGDEAKHFQLLQGRLSKLGITLDDFIRPPDNELFAYLKSLRHPVEKVAAGQFALELLAYKVNELFMSYCRTLGDEETAQLYEHLIQPEELHHQQMGRQLLEKYAVTDETQQMARSAAAKTLELASGARQRVAEKLGSHCFPGC